jgi:hypothetical protein
MVKRPTFLKAIKKEDNFVAFIFSFYRAGNQRSYV